MTAISRARPNSVVRVLDKDVAVDVEDVEAATPTNVVPSSESRTLRSSREVPVHAPVVGLNVKETWLDAYSRSPIRSHSP